MTETLLRGVSGTIYVNEQRYASYMSPYGKELTDAEILQLITYIRTEINDYPTDDTWTEQKVKELRTNLTEAKAIRGQKELDALISVGSPPQTMPENNQVNYLEQRLQTNFTPHAGSSSPKTVPLFINTLTITPMINPSLIPTNKVNTNVVR